VGETELVALKRELREELGIELSRPLERPFARLADDATGLHMTIWLIDYEGQISNCAPGEHDELRWIAGHDIAGVALAHASYPEILGRALVAAAQ
jgi:8-oxo-dGTP pyrophosphatase MutT (NUDIX family)